MRKSEREFSILFKIYQYFTNQCLERNAPQSDPTKDPDQLQFIQIPDNRTSKLLDRIESCRYLQALGPAVGFSTLGILTLYYYRENREQILKYSYDFRHF